MHCYVVMGLAFRLMKAAVRSGQVISHPMTKLELTTMAPSEVTAILVDWRRSVASKLKIKQT